MNTPEDFVIEGTTLVRYTGKDPVAVVPEGITCIGDHAFCFVRETLRKVVLPESVMRIEWEAFNNCKLLEEINIPESVSFIGQGAFTFTNISEFKLNVPLDQYGNGVFPCCGKIMQIDIPDGTKAIPPGMFEFDFILKTVAFPDSVEIIGDSSFYGCGLEEVMLPPRVKQINRLAFCSCRKLRSISFPDGLEEIGNCAFTECALQTITLPESLQTVEPFAFSKCRQLTEVRILGSNFHIEKHLFDESDNISYVYAPKLPLSELISVHLAVPAVKAYLDHPEEYQDANIVAEYQKYLIAQRRKLLPLIFENDCVHAVKLFSERRKITDENYPCEYLEPARAAKAEKCIAFLEEWRAKTKYKAPKKIVSPKADDPFSIDNQKKTWDWEKLEDGSLVLQNYKGQDCIVRVPGRIGKYRVSQIGDYVFSPLREYRKKTQADALRKITDIELPAGILRIGKGAFAECSSLTHVSLPDGLCKIDAEVFLKCKNLAEISLPDSVFALGNKAFSYCESLINVVFPPHIEAIPEECCSWCKKIERIDLPSSIKCIGNRAFLGCRALNSVQAIPANVQIGNEAFSLCDSLANAEGLVVIQNILFECLFKMYCDAEKIVVPEGVTRIDRMAFLDAHCVKHIVLPSTLNRIEFEAFCLSNKLINIVLPESVAAIGDNAFEDCSSLQEVTINSRSIDISQIAFRKCPALKTVYAPHLSLSLLTEAKLLKQAKAFYKAHPDADYDPDVRIEYEVALKMNKNK